MCALYVWNCGKLAGTCPNRSADSCPSLFLVTSENDVGQALVAGLIPFKNACCWRHLRLHSIQQQLLVFVVTWFFCVCFYPSWLTLMNPNWLKWEWHAVSCVTGSGWLPRISRAVEVVAQRWWQCCHMSRMIALLWTGWSLPIVCYVLVIRLHFPRSCIRFSRVRGHISVTESLRRMYLRESAI